MSATPTPTPSPTDLPTLTCDDPAADPLDCVAVQLPTETQGRDTTDAPAVTATPVPEVAQTVPQAAVSVEILDVAHPAMLAATGVPVAPYVAVALVLVLVGTSLCRWAR